MSGDHIPGVLNPAGPLEQRLKQVTQLTEDAEQRSDQQAIPNADLRQKSEASKDNRQNSTDDAAETSLDTLVGTDLWIKFALTKITPDEIGSSITHHYDQKSQKNPCLPIRQQPQQENMTQQKRQIQEAKTEPAKAMMDLRDIRQAKQKQDAQQQYGDSHKRQQQGCLLGIQQGDRNSPGKCCNPLLEVMLGSQPHLIEFQQRQQQNHGEEQ